MNYYTDYHFLAITPRLFLVRLHFCPTAKRVTVGRFQSFDSFETVLNKTVNQVSAQR